ncbi:hypothetical protein CSQ28_002597 [Salmonella enterica subsp. houtenae]|nr:hypothetical protein [Salmonella enterica subsp. houtenae]EEE2292784.1 hypothetical protein [Salmonella enterica subsp. houtenae]SUF52591.1 Uncharacterised protein [Salmonella enterica]
MSRSFAVWGCRNFKIRKVSGYNPAHSSFIDELHINFWNVSSHKLSYLDFGITFHHPVEEEIASNGAICIFLPFKKKPEFFSDLSDNLESSKDLVTAVFNEYLINRETLDERHLKLVLDNKGDLIINTKLAFNNSQLDQRVKISEADDGTLVVFRLNDCLSDSHSCKHYIRFRIKLDPCDLKALVKTFYPKDLFLKSNIERSDIVDFRINEQRNLPSEISTTLASAACTPLKTHLFIIRDMVDECSASGSNYKGCRILESETWTKYFDKSVSFGPHDPMIYHWKIANDKDSRLNDFSVVVKFKNTKTKITKIIFYLLYGAAFAFVLKFIPTQGYYIAAAFAAIIIYISAHFWTYRK